jgi:hypothetical protein
MGDIMTPPGEAQDTISTTTNLLSPPEATNPPPKDSNVDAKATQDPPRSPKRKANDDGECAEATPTPPKKCKVTFNAETSVRTESDIDILRHQYTSNTVPDESTRHTIRPLNGTQRGRRSLCWRKSTRYLPGDWAITKGRENVNTSGCGSKGNLDRYAEVDEAGDEKLWRARQKEWDVWNEYVKALDAGAKKEDRWSELMRDPRAFLVARPRIFLRNEDWADMLLGTIAKAPGAHLLVSALLWQFIKRD